MTPLGQRIGRAIAAQGPITIQAFMALCSGEARQGYYRGRDPLGADGDFVTGPEISQLMGELIGLGLAQAWIDRGRPAQVRLAEIGPGRGTLMADLLRAAASVPGFAAALTLHLVETNPRLVERQRRCLAHAAPVWHGALAELPADAPLFLVANEFLDVLPIRQFVATGGGWRERCVTLDAAGALAMALHPKLLPPEALPATERPEGLVVEISPAREAVATELAQRIVRQGGLALLVDYGAERLAGDTLKAVARHREVDPLAAPGEADLSADVDFGSLAASALAAGAAVHGPLPQGAWLQRLGIGLRLERLVRRATPAQADALVSGARRLTDPTAMGERFKVLALTDAAGPTPPGFTAEDRRP